MESWGSGNEGGWMGNSEPFLCHWWLKLRPMIVKMIAEQVTELCYLYYIGNFGKLNLNIKKIWEMLGWKSGIHDL